MQLRINDITVDVPADLSQVSLGRFVEYWDRYGRDLDRRLDELNKAQTKDAFMDQIDYLELELDEAVSWYSFFSGYEFDLIKTQHANELLIYYRSIRQMLSTSQTYELGKIIEWNGERWMISDWRITPGAFTFNELLTSKEITRQIHHIGKGRWEALPYLCAVFMRKVDEPFSEKLVEAGGNRIAMMQKLPMSFALQVAFFLSVSVNIFKRILVFSKDRAAKMPA